METTVWANGVCYEGCRWEVLSYPDGTRRWRATHPRHGVVATIVADASSLVELPGLGAEGGAAVVDIRLPLE